MNDLSVTHRLTGAGNLSAAGGEANFGPSPLDASALGRSEAIDADPQELRDRFTEFVGQTFFGSVLASMRKTVGKPAYMHGGRGEEVFQQQLDQVIVKELSTASADQFADPMFDLFQMQRRG